MGDPKNEYRSIYAVRCSKHCSVLHFYKPLLISENILNGKIRDNPTYGCNDEKAEHCAVSLLNLKCQMFYAYEI